MAYKTNSIGASSFIALRGEAEGLRYPVELITRPNTTDVSTRIFARKGVPFSLWSVSSHDTETTANSQYTIYLELLNSGLQTLIKDNLNFETQYSVKHRVLNVVIRSIIANTIMAGNVNANDKYLMTCEWQLIAVGV